MWEPQLVVQSLNQDIQPDLKNIWRQNSLPLLAWIGRQRLSPYLTGCPKSQTSFCFLPFSQTKFIQNANVGGVLKNSGNLLHDKHKNFENRFRNS